MKEQQVILPSTYTEEIWKRGGGNNRNKKYIGKPYISWSQIEMFNSLSGFNTSLNGQFEYVRKYFSGETHKDMGWGAHGKAVESYICLRDKKKVSEEDKADLDWANNHFSETEKNILKSIKPLGVFQYEVCLYIEELDCIVLGYIDDMTKPNKQNEIKMLRDYKTKSKTSKSDLHKPEKHQLEIYTMALNQYGYSVLNAEYVVIERTGGMACMNGGGKESLGVGSNVWIEPYASEKLTEKRFEETKKLIISSIKQISQLFNTFNKV